MSRRLTVAAMLCACVATAAGGTVPAGTGAKRPAVLFVTTAHGPMWRLYMRKYMREETRRGFAMDWRPWPDLTWERLRQFNVAVLVHGGTSSEGLDKLPKTIEAGAKLLKRFMDSGGGVLVDPVGSGRLHQWQFLLKPYGGMMYAERVHEADRLVRTGTPFNIKFARTDNIQPHPVTRGVKNIWYPFSPLKQWDTLCFPLETGPEWQVVVSGMASSRSEVVPAPYHAKHDNVPVRKQGAASAVPLVAVRNVGTGRLALVGVPEVFTYDAGVSPGVGRLFLSTGLDGVPSDGAVLLRNLYRWLAEPSLKGKTLGGWKTDPARIRRASGPPKDWRPPIRRAFPAPRRTFHALVGAQTKRSGGRSTLAQYKAAARQAKLDLLVFLEDVTRIDPDAFEQFKADCRAASDDTLVLVPGLKLTDQSRNRYFLFGPKMKYPPTSALDAKRRFRTLDKHYVLAGVLGYFYSVSLFGKYGHSGNGNPAWDLRCQQAIALATYENGTVVDRLSLEQYAAVQDASNHLEPITVHLVRDASAVGKAATTGEQTYFHETDLAKLRANIREPYYTPYTFTTSGPRIDVWQAINREYTGYDWFDPAGMRWAVRFRVTSDVGLKQVDVYDGRRRMRTFRPGGKKTVARELHLLHEQQKELFLVATDTNGHTATSGTILDTNWLQKVYWLIDRHNHGTYCQQRADSEWGFSYLWQPTVPSLYLYHGRVWDALIHDINTSEITTPGFDGPPGNTTRVAAHLAIYGKGRYYTTQNWANQVEQPLANQDCVIWESHMTYEYEPLPKGVKFYIGSRPASHVSSTMQGWQRYVNFNIKHGMPAVSLVEGRMKILRDIPLDVPRHGLPIMIGDMRAHGAGDTSIFAAQHTGAHDVVTHFDRRPPYTGIRNVHGKFPKGSYVTIFPSSQGSTTVFSLDDNLSYHYLGRGWCWFGPRHPGKVLSKGTVLRWRYAFMTGMGRDRNATRKIEQVRDWLGIDGSPGYKIALEAGRILSQEFICRLDGREQGVAGTFPVKDLPCTLPLVVEGVNDNWTCVLYERKRKRYRPLGMLDGKAYVQLGVGTEDPSLFIGHPLTCDAPDVVLHLVEWDAKSFRLVLHNPTAAAKKVTVKPSPYFTLLSEPSASFSVSVPAGNSVTRTLPIRR